MRLLSPSFLLKEILSKVVFTCNCAEALMRLLPRFCLQFAKVWLYCSILIIQLAFPLRRSTFLRFFLRWLLFYILLFNNLRFLSFDLFCRRFRWRQAWFALLCLWLIHFFINRWLYFRGLFLFLENALKGDVATSAVYIILIFWHIFFKEPGFLVEKLDNLEIKLHQVPVSSLQNICLNFL